MIPGRSATHWQDLTRVELDACISVGSVAVLPLAAIEQHGAHLPLSADLDIGLGLLEAAVARLPEHFPLLRLPPETAIGVIEAYGDSVARAGVRRLVLFNSHGGNKAVAEIAALRLRERWGMLVVKAHYFRFAPPAQALPADELRHGLHGNT